MPAPRPRHARAMPAPRPRHPRLEVDHRNPLTRGVLSSLNRQQSYHNSKTSPGDAKRFKQSRKTLVGKRSAGALHRLFRRFERARSRVRATETSEIPGPKT
eukprot:gene15523-biopygen3691